MYFGWVLSGSIFTFDSKIPPFVTSMQINTPTVLSLRTGSKNEVFEKESLGISEHHTTKQKDNFS